MKSFHSKRATLLLSLRLILTDGGKASCWMKSDGIWVAKHFLGKPALPADLDTPSR